jgi:glutathione S-transferase
VYQLYIGNKNYSSWSLRPWLLMRALEIPFEELLLPFGDEEAWQPFRRLSAAAKVPCLVVETQVVWESLAIVEYLAERHAGVWPTEAVARAWARSAAAEMHAGFAELRAVCSMNCGVRVRLKEISQPLLRDIGRLDTLWTDGLTRFGGPFLAGPEFSAVDAFYAPVAFRVQTYSLALRPEAAAYVETLLALPAMQEWYAAALREPFRDVPHEADLARAGTVTQDLRLPVGLR